LRSFYFSRAFIAMSRLHRMSGGSKDNSGTSGQKIAKNKEAENDTHPQNIIK